MKFHEFLITVAASVIITLLILGRWLEHGGCLYHAPGEKLCVQIVRTPE